MILPHRDTRRISVARTGDIPERREFFTLPSDPPLMEPQDGESLSGLDDGVEMLAIG